MRIAEIIPAGAAGRFDQGVLDEMALDVCVSPPLGVLM